jgi:putative folate metabolism gamma-glutamate ligase
MIVRAIKTRAFLPPKDDLFSVIKQSFLGYKIKEKSIIVITSKIVSIWQGRCIKISKNIKKDDLVKKESDFYINRKETPKNYAMLTIKNNILIPMAGIDESNANGYYILWPEKPFLVAEQIYNFIKNEYNLKNFGIIISDSHTTPLRSGIVGIGISYYGFYPKRDYRNKKDIFKRTIKMSQTNIVDSLASSAVYLMGEGSERTPIAIIEDAGNIKFETKKYKKNPIGIDISEDIYAPIIKNKKWKKGGSNN